MIGCVPLSTGAAAGSPRAHGVHAHRQVEHPLTFWPTYWRRGPAPASGHRLTYWPTWQRTSAPASGTYSDLLTLILREYTDTCDWNIRWPIDLHSNGVHGGHSASGTSSELFIDGVHAGRQVEHHQTYWPTYGWRMTCALASGTSSGQVTNIVTVHTPPAIGSSSDLLTFFFYKQFHLINKAFFFVRIKNKTVITK